MKKHLFAIAIVGVAVTIALLGLYALLHRVDSKKKPTTGSLMSENQSQGGQGQYPATKAEQRIGEKSAGQSLPPALSSTEVARRRRAGSVAPVTVPPPSSLPTDRPPVFDQMEEELPPGLAEERAEQDAVPPGLNQPDIPPSMLGQINAFVQESKRSAGPQAVELGQQLLTSTNPLLRVAGVAVLSENGALNETELRSIASDEDPAVAINSLGWLLDHGQTAEAGTLQTLLGQGSIDSTQLINMIDSDQLNASGSRAALDILSSNLSGEEARALYSSISQDQTHEYSVRMKATLLMRETTDFETFRNEVNRLYAEASAEDPLWQEGITRLANRIEGPVEVQAGTATLTANDIDEMLAREYPMTLEDMAQQLEYVLSQEDAYVAPGTADRLAERLADLKKLPWTEDQQVSLTRIEIIAEQLPALEQDQSEPPPNLPQPPPDLQ